MSAVVIAAIALVTGIVLFATTIGAVDAEHVGNVGLVAQAGLGYWAAIACVVFAFAVTMMHVARCRWLPLAPLLVFVVMLYGLAAIPESLGRLQPAWLHAGFIEFIERTGTSAPGIDGRFAWPGAFAVVAFADRVASVSTAVTLLRWAPLAFALAYLAPLWSIATAMVSDVRARWLALWLFVITNWIGQDYLSPQAVAYLFYLVIIAILLRWFRPTGPPRAIWDVGRSPREKGGTWFRRARVHIIAEGRAQDEVGVSALPPSSLALMVVLVTLLFGACVASHPLTPTFILAVLLTLAATGRIAHRGILAMFGIMFGAWLSWGAVTFWSGHRSDVVGGGSPGANVNANVGGHLLSSDPGHRIVVYTRLLMTAVLIVTAAIGALRRHRQGHRDNTLILCALAPFPIVLVQAYGGESLLRSYLFALPFLTVLAALAWPWGTDSGAEPLRASPAPKRQLLGLYCLFAISIISVVVSITARYGNERFEMMRPTDLSAVRYVYANAHRGDTIYAANGNLPWQYMRVEQYDYRTLPGNGAPTGSSLVDTVRERARPGHNLYLVFTQSQDALGEVFLGLPKGWMARDQREVDASKAFQLVFQDGSARVYLLAPMPDNRTAAVGPSPAKPNAEVDEVRRSIIGRQHTKGDGAATPKLMPRSIARAQSAKSNAGAIAETIGVLAFAALGLLVRHVRSMSRQRRKSVGAPAPSPRRHSQIWPIGVRVAAAASCLFAIQQVAQGSGITRGVAVFSFLLGVPGFALVGWTAVRDVVLATCLALAVSVGVGILCAQTMLWTHRWSPLAAFWILAAGCLVSLGGQITKTLKTSSP